MIKKVAIIGSHGLYANYGGWDELVKNLAEKKAEGIQYLIFNSVDSPPQEVVPAGVTVRQLTVKADGYQGIFYDFWSILLCYRKVDAILLLGVQGLPLIWFLRFFKKVRIVANVGGIEWLRPKFGYFVKQYFRWCFNLCMIHADIVILDNPHYRSFLPRRIKAGVKVVPYGGVIDNSLTITEEMERKYPFLLTDYCLSVSRSLEDNQIEPLCQSFIGSDHQLVLISNLSGTAYGQRILKKYSNYPNIILIDGLYHKPALDLVRRHCRAYIHTHTLCGTAPSLVEMMIAQRPILSVDNPQNRFTLKGEGYLFSSFQQVQDLLNSREDLTRFIASKEACESYEWAKIVKEYESFYSRL